MGITSVIIFYQNQSPSFSCNNEGTGCLTNRTIAAVLAITVLYLTNEATGYPINITFVTVLVQYSILIVCIFVVLYYIPDTAG